MLNRSGNLNTEKEIRDGEDFVFSYLKKQSSIIFPIFRTSKNNGLNINFVIDDTMRMFSILPESTFL